MHKNRFIHIVICLPLLAILQFQPVSAENSETILSPNDFVITVKTDNFGVSSDTQFTIPTDGSGYNYNVDCENDGSNEIVGANGNYTCDYGSGNEGTYQIRIEDNSGSGTGFPQIMFNGSGESDKLISIDQWGTGIWRSMAYAFDGCENMVMTATDAPDLSLVSNMEFMFNGARSFNGDISEWDTGNVQDMSGLFRGAWVFNQDIGSWDTGQVWNMANMFEDAFQFNQDIGAWVTDNVQDMSSMFRDAVAFNQDIGDWNTSTVFGFSHMFDGAAAFNQDIGNWDTGGGAVMGYMFRDAVSFDQNIGGWDISNVGDLQNLFEGVQLSTANYDALLNGWATQSVISARTFDGGNSTFCTGESGRDTLTNIFGWTISDAGKDCLSISQQEMFYSQAAYDGWVLETGENTNKGGLINTSNLICNVGDDPQNKQFRTILHFNTSRIPDDAVVTAATLQYKQHSIIGSDPYATHGNLWADIKDGFFSNNPGLVVSDFAAGPSMGFAGNFSLYPSALAYPIYRANLKDTSFQYLNLDGITQFRLRFAVDDDNDNTADYIKIFCGDMGVPFNRPVLRVWYYVP